MAPWELRSEHADALYAAGWSASELVHAVLGCAHFNDLNRMADGLGIRDEYVSSLTEFEPLTGAVLLERVRMALALDAERRARRAQTQRLCERRARLSRREREVLDLVLSGRLNKVIALEIGIGESTVEVHRRRMMAKLEVRNVAELVRLYAGLPS